MHLQASKLDLLPYKNPSSSPSISSLLFDHSSNSLLLSFSDSSHLLFPSFSPSPPFPPPTAIPPFSTAISFLRLLPTNHSLFVTSSPLDAGAALSLRAWILRFNPPRFVPIRLCYKKIAPAVLPLAHGFGVRVVGTVNYFVVHSPVAGQIWVMGVKMEGLGVDLVKCAVVDCDLPIYAIGMSMGFMVLGEIGGVRVFSVRVLVKGKGKRKGQVDDDGNLANGKLRCARLRQNSDNLCSFFIKIKCTNASSETNAGAMALVKAMSIHVLSQKKFLILDSFGDLHLLTVHGTFTASETLADSSSKYAHMYCLDVKMKVRVLAVPPDISARPEFLWISDGAYSVHMMSMTYIESPEKDGEKDDKKEKSTLLSAAQVIFTSEKVHHIIAVSSKTLLVLGQGNIFAYSIS